MIAHNVFPQPNLYGTVLHEREFKQFRDLIYRISGINILPTKKPLVTSRLEKRLTHYKMKSYSDYFRMITSSNGAEELQVAVDLLTTNETHFFREPKHFDFLRQRVLSIAKPHNKTLRIWSAACSSGEEPYSIAMLLHETLGERSWEIVASDLCTRMLEKARMGVYPIDRMSEIPKHYLLNYCLKGARQESGTLLIQQKLRERVRFIQHNLIEPPPKLGMFDVIFLRNVLIYFDNETKAKVISRLLPSLHSGGYFLIGHSESLNGVTESVRLVQPAVYLKP